MKRVISLITLLLLCMNIGAQNKETSEYKPLLTNGKVWKVLIKKDFCPDAYEMIRVSGDTIVNGRTCKRIVVETDTYVLNYAAYEENQKVYCYYHDTTETKLMLDFGLEKGDVVYAGNTCVTDVDYITVNGIKRKRITIDDHRNRIIYFVEGIGLNFEFWMDPSFAYPDNEQRYMVECYDNGLLIFSQSDFAGTNSIDTISTDDTVDYAKYSLTGIRIDGKDTGRIYIKNGKKYLTK